MTSIYKKTRQAHWVEDYGGTKNLRAKIKKQAEAEIEQSLEDNREWVQLYVEDN